MSDMLEEVYRFENDMGRAILYKEPRVMGFAVQKLTNFTCDTWLSKMYRCDTKQEAVVKFNWVRGTLRAMQTRRDKNK